jgi:hypothetical protein
MMRTAVLAGFVLWVSFAARPLEARDEKAPEIKEVMGKVGKPGGLYPGVAMELREADPMWEQVQQDTKEMAKLLATLGQATPPKGDKDSWAKLTRAFIDNAKALEKAAAKRDLKAARDVSKKMGDSCKGCHAAHRLD